MEKNSNMKQTAVEWLVDEIAEKYNFRFATYYGQEIQQAKEMEKEQMCQFVSDYLDDGQDMTAEKYYEQTYGGE